MKKKVLLLEWASFGTPFIIQSFNQLGYDVEKYQIPREKVDTRNHPYDQEEKQFDYGNKNLNTFESIASC